MRSAKRVIVVVALGLPVLLGAPVMALACGEQGQQQQPPSPAPSQNWSHSHSDDQSQDQDQDASTEQSNNNKPIQYTFNVGSGEANAVSWNHQATDADTEQNEAAWQED
jgi:hypothetical protein